LGSGRRDRSRLLRLNGSFVRRRLGLFGGFRGIFGSSLLPFRGRGSHGGEKRRRKGREGEGRRELRFNVQGGTIWSGRSQEFWWFSHGWQSPRLIPIRGSLPFVLPSPSTPSSNRSSTSSSSLSFSSRLDATKSPSRDPLLQILRFLLPLLCHLRLP